MAQTKQVTVQDVWWHGGEQWIIPPGWLTYDGTARRGDRYEYKFTYAPPTWPSLRERVENGDCDE